MSDGLSHLAARVCDDLSAKRAAHRYREFFEKFWVDRRARVETAAPVIDLTHNDYLDLRHHEVFQSAARAAAAHLPVGSGGSRLLGGDYEVFAELENAFARWKGKEASLYFPSGYAANEGIAQVLAGQDSAFFSDQYNHASIIDGIRLGQPDRTRRVVFPHRNYHALAALLQKSSADINVIFTESLYSMDGDTPDFGALRELAQKFRGVLVVDEAHAVGCLGDEGRGLTAGAADVISIDTCGKALGVQGAFVSGPRWLREYLINTARSFIFTTAPSPWIAAALGVALDFVPRLQAERQRLSDHGKFVREALRAADIPVTETTSHIVGVLCFEDARAMALQDHLAAREIYARAIRPPTVAPGTARVRLPLHAGLTQADVERLVRAIEDFFKHAGV